jgi:hypothetical protein
MVVFAPLVVNRTLRLVVALLTIVPPLIDQLYVAPAVTGTEAIATLLDKIVDGTEMVASAGKLTEITLSSDPVAPKLFVTNEVSVTDPLAGAVKVTTRSY